MGTENRIRFFLLLVVVLCVSAEAFAQRRYAIGVTAGSSGIGGDAIVRINDRVNVRGGYQEVFYKRTGVYNDLEVGIDYNGNVDVSSFSILADVYPFKKVLKFTAGVYKLNWKSTALALPNESYEVADRTFSPEQLGSLSADVSYSEKIAPYVGMGFGNALAKGLPVKINVDLGLVRSGAPIIDMEGTGLIAPTADNEDSFQEGLNEFDWYPIVRVGFSFAFIKVN